MSKKPDAKSKKGSAAAKRRAPRRTRMIALEPRMLFDGALGIDLGAKATAALQGDAVAQPAETITPAAPQAQAEAAVRTLEQSAVERTAERLGIAAEALGRNEIVFVDSRVRNDEGLLAGIGPNATVYYLDAGKDGLAQIADVLSKRDDVSALHIVALGNADSLQLGSTRLTLESMQGLAAQRLSSVSEHLTEDAAILVHRADFGQGEAGAATANRLALLTSADVVDVDRDGGVEIVGTPARQEIVFVDPTVRDFQALIDGIDNPNARVVLLDPTRDGVRQMADVLRQYKSVDAVHVISHGSEGQLDLGSSVLNSITMSGTYAQELAAIGAHLGKDADFLVYGCDFGRGAGGEAAAQALAQLTGADVAASTDATGHAALGADWDLELRTGAIDSEVALERDAQEAWRDVLALHTLDFDSVSAWVGGTSKTYTVDGYPVTIGFGGSLNGNPNLASDYTGGVAPAQNALQFTLGPTGSNTITIDFSGQPGGSVANVGFALYDVDNAESAVFTANQAGVGAIAPTQVATSAFNSVTASSGTSTTVSGSGANAGTTSPNGNTYVYFNTTDITSVSFTYNGVANVTLVVLNDITFMGKTTNPPVVDLDAASTGSETAGDAFATQAYTGTSGTIPWTGNWVETDATAGGSAVAGQVQVIDTPTAGTNYGLRLNNSGTAGQFTGAARGIDLSGYVASTLTYSFVTSAGLSAADSVVVEVSSNGGTNWTLLKTYTGSSASAANYTNDSVSLSGYESANTMIRFRISGTAAYTGAAEYFYVDNVQVSGMPTGSGNLYTEGDVTGVLIAATANAAITDADSASMSSARIVIGNFATGDTLTWSAGGTSITGSYDSATGVLSLSGTDTLANYQAVLNTIRYLSTSDDPTAGGTLTNRDISVTVRDSGGNESNAAISKVTLTAVNDAPVNTVPATAVTVMNAPLVLSSANGNALSVADIDAATVRVTLTSTNGTLTLSGIAGLAFTTGDGTADVTMTFSGTQAAVNAALDGLSYSPTAGYTGAASISITTSDLGGTGTGGTLTDTDSVSVTVLASNILDLNSTPGSVPGAPSTAVTDLVTGGAMTGANGATPAGWTEGGATGQGGISGNRYAWTGNSSGAESASLNQNITVPATNTVTTYSSTGTQLIETSTVTTNAITSISFDYIWDNNDNNDHNRLTVYYNGVLLGTFDTGIAGGTNGSWTGFNVNVTSSVAVGTGIAAQGNIGGTMSSITLTFNTPVTASGALSFRFGDATTGAGGDDIAIDNVVVNNTATSVTTVTTVDLAANGWNTTYTENGAAVSIADSDSSVFDAAAANLTGATITLTNAQTNDRLLVGGSSGASGTVNGIGWTRAGDTITLSGSFSKAQYADAMEQITFDNTSDNPSTTQRVITVQVNDGTTASNVATTTIDVVAVNDAPMNTVPGARTVNEDTALTFTGGNTISVSDAEGNVSSAQLTVSNGTLNVSLAGGATISSGANGSSTLTLSGTQAQINAALATLSYQGSLDFNGSDTLTVLSTDANGATDSDTVSITVNAVNDGPVNTVPGAQTVNEDTALAIGGVSVNDVDGNLSTTQLTVANGVLNVSLAGGATISAGANGSSTLTLSGTQAQINAALASLSYQGNADFNGSDTLTVLSTDASAATDSDSVSITVNSVNDGPVNTVPGAQSVNEDTALAIAGVSVNDVDGNLSTAQLSVTNGVLNVSLAGGAIISAGANGSSTLTLSGTQAQINAALASLSYQGNLNFNGADTLTVLSTDGNGATDSDTVAITVNAVNDGPVNTVPGAQSVNEDTALAIGGISVNDVDGNLATTQLTVSNGVINLSLAGGATISAGANGSSTLTLSGTQAQINAALASVSYQGNLNFNGSDTLTVLSTDGNGVTDSDSVSITVNSVNDGPVNTVPGAQSVNEDTALSIGGVSVNDVDGNLSTTQLTVTNGTLNVSLAGGATISAGANGSATLTLSGTQAQINAALASLSYQGSLDFNGADTLTVLSTDGNGITDSDTVAITVNAVNDGPVNTVPGAQSVNEDTALAIGGVSVNDVDGNLSTTQLTVSSGVLNVSLAGGASISAGANGSSTLTLSGTQAQINAALASISYQGNLNFNGADTLTVLSTDGNGITDSDTVAITVNAVNDGPVNTVPGAQSVNEDTALAIGGVSVNDVDGNLSTTRLTVTNGTLNVSLAGGATISAGANGSSTLTLSGTQAQINAALASISYQGNPDFNGADTLTVLSTDANGATDSDAVAITVNSVNDGPVNTVPGAQTVNEDTALSIGGVSVNDVDGNLSTTQLTVTNGVLNVSLAGGATISAGANGSSTLTLSGTQAQINAALASLSYQGNPDFNGAETLTLLSTDANGVTDSDAVAITVNSVNDGPVNTVPGAQSVNEDSPLAIGGVSVSDVDGNLATTRLTVTNGTVSVSLAGGATISAGANGSSTLTLSGTQAQINAALATIGYQGNAEFNGADTLTVLSTDANGATDSDAVAIAVSPVNDGPVNAAPAAVSVNEDTALSFSGANAVSVNDVDGNLSTTQLTVTNGVLNVSLAGGATISAGANGSSTLTLSGTQAQINAALASLAYQGNPDFNGADTLTVLSTDSNGATDSDSVAITVSPVNDGPLNAVPGAQTVNEDTLLSIGGLGVNDVDGNLSTTQLTVTNGVVNVSLAGGATISAGANGSSTLTLSGTQAQINAALASLSYQGNVNFNGADMLTVLSTDGNGATDSDTVAITVNSVNDGPMNSVPGAQSVNEDTVLSIGGVSVNDVDGNLSTTQLSVSNGTLNVSLAGGATISAGANGSATLTLSGTQAQINAALASLAYQGNTDFNGADALTVLSTDSNGATDSDAVAITVSSVNDGPVNTVPGAQAVNEDTVLSIGGVSVNDVDGNLSTAQLTVANGVVDVSLAGGATISAGANGSSTLTLSGTQAQINAALASLSYQGNADFNGADTLTVLSTDGNGATDSDSVAITVNSVNDGPLNTVPGAQAVNEDTVLPIGGISVNDVDGNLATTQLSVSNGALNVSLAGGATISAGANGSSTLTLSGTQAQINAALASLSYQGNADFNGAETLTVLSTDANGATDSDSVAITVSPVNDGPVNTVPGAQAVNEDTVLPIAGVSVNDVDGNLATTQLSVTNGTLNVSLAGGATISAGANGSATLTLSGTQAQINAALASLSYQGNAEFNGGDTLTVLSTDGNGVTDSDAVAITVSSVNDGPLNTVPGAQTVNEDTLLSIGGISVNDVDGNLSTTQLTVGNGVLNVSLAGGATISAGANGSSTLTLSGTQAQINAALASLSYQGNADFNGGDTLTVLSTDGNGATDTDAVSITVNAVNDGPVNAVPGAQTVNEDTVLPIGGISVNDVDGNLATTQLTVTNGVVNVSLAGGATIIAGANGSSTLTLSGTQAQINAALASISYQGNADFNGADTLTVLSTDTNGATDSDAVSIAVTSVNDGPVNTVPGAQAVNEDTLLSIAGISVNDVDGNLSTTQLTVANGVLNVSLAGGATISAGANGSSTLTLSGTQAQINAALASLAYQGNADFNGADTLTVVSTDANGAADSDAVTITVSPINDGPLNTVPGAQTVAEDTVLPIAGLSVNDIDGNLATTQLSVTNGTLNVSLAGGATISAGANGSSTLTLSGTQAQINAALASLSYQGNLDFDGADTLAVLSIDANGATDSDTIAITVTPVGDGPVNVVPGAQSVNEDTPLAIGGISVTDPDGNLATTQLTVANGTVSVNLAGGASITAGANGSSTLTLSGTQAQINAALATLSYQGNPNFSGADVLTVLSTDGLGQTDSDAVAITVNWMNDAPVVAVPGAQTVNEDTALPIGGLSVGDVDGNLSATQLSVTNGVINVSLAGGATISAGANGSSTLTLSGTQAQINAALASLSYQGNADFNGADTLTVLSTDASGASDSDTVLITVNPVNDGPVNTVPGAQSVNEDTAAAIGGISVNDVDGNLSTTQLTVANGVLNVSLAGGATINAGANGSSTLTLSGTQAQINAALASLSYQGNPDFNGADTLTVLSSDANGVTDSDALAITVTSVNDGPVNAVPGAQTVNEDTALSIGGISVNDVDGNLATTQLSVANGTLNVSLAGGATISAGANGSSTLTLSGTQAQINAALASLSYQGNPDFSGGDTLSVVSTDANGAADSDAVAITVNPVNDGPVNTVPGAQTVNEDTVLAIGGISVNDVDGNLSSTQLTATNGVLNVSLAGGATISAGANGSPTLTLAGTQAQINAALASLSYQGNPNFNGADTLTVLSTDGNGVTDSDAISITVSSVNDGPVNSVPGAQTVNEDTALSIAGVTVNDVDGNLSTTQLTVTNGVLNVSLAGGATISAGANGSSTLTLSGTQAQINAALASLAYQGNADFSGADTLTVLSTDSNGATDSDAVAITVNSVNDGPVNTLPGAQTVNEDSPLAIAGVSVNDVDGNLAATQLTVIAGTLNVNLAGGATISAGANGSSSLTLSGTQAQINAALATLGYQGNANFSGSDTLTVLSTDANGATDADSVAITVVAVNDGPVNAAPATVTAIEDTAFGFTGVNAISVNDVDGNLASTQLTVANGTLTVSLAGGATISAGANGSSTLTLSGTQAQINAALASLTYQGNLDYTGADTLTVLSADTNGATDSDAVSITVSAAADVPVNVVPGAQSVNEDTVLAIAGVSVSDADGNLATTQLTVANGVISVSLAGGATISAGANGSSTLTLSGTQAQINAALASISYQGNADFSGADILAVLSTDAIGASDSDTVAISVNPVNDGPFNTVPGAQTVNEDTALPIGGLSVNDIDGNLASTQLTVANGTLNVSLAGGATISAGANGSSTLMLSGTQAQINAALASLSYQGNADFTGADTLTVLSSDSNGATDSDTVAITVSPVNDGPVNTVPGAQTVNEDTLLAIAGISVNDVDGNLATTQLSVTNGVLNVSLAGGATISAGANGSSTLTLSGTQAQINAALASLSYQGNPDFNGADTLTVLATDSNGATDSDAVAITVSSVNDGPVNSVPGAQTVNEDTLLPIAGIAANDGDGNLATTQLGVTSGVLNVSLAGGATISAGANGSSTLTLSGTQAQINAALASLSYQGNPDFTGADTLTVLSTDANGATDSDAVAITVSAVNDGPVNSVPGAQSVNEDTLLAIGGLSVNDVDGNLASTQLTVTNGVLNVSLAGGATISAGANGTATLTLSGTQAQINAALASLSYQGNANFNGADTLTVLSTDSNGATDSDAVAIAVSSVNDGPVNTLPGAQVVNEDTASPIAGLSVNDVEGNLTATRLTVTNGMLNVSLAGGATISAGANGSSTLTLSGTQAQINAALASLTYQGNADFSGGDTLVVVSSDASGATDSDALAIMVTAINDAPVVNSAASATFAEDMTGAVYTATRSDPDAGDSVTWTLTGADAALFAIDPVGGVVTLSAAQDFAAPGDANGDGVYEIRVRATDSSGLFDERNVQLTLTEASIAMPFVSSGTPMALPPAPAAPLPTLPHAPTGPLPPDRPLGVPVDAGVAPADLARVPGPAASGGAAADAQTNLDLNALPPTGAGQPASFGLARLSRDEAIAFLLPESPLPREIGGHRLFIYHGMSDMRVGYGAASLRVPTDAFAHTDPTAVVHLQARLEDGSPLPAWLRFDGLRGVFTGFPPEGTEETLEIEIVARDTEGREARIHFTLEIAALRNTAAAAGIALGFDVDKEEAEKARREAKGGSATAGVRPTKPAGSFSDQVSAAKAPRDPLLDRITSPDKAKPGTRR